MAKKNTTYEPPVVDEQETDYDQQSPEPVIPDDVDKQIANLSNEQYLADIIIGNRPKRDNYQGWSNEAWNERLAIWHEKMLRKVYQGRWPRLLAAMRSMGQLATHNPTPEQQAKIIQRMLDAVEEVRVRLAGVVAQPEEFSL